MSVKKKILIFGTVFFLIYFIGFLSPQLIQSSDTPTTEAITQVERPASNITLPPSVVEFARRLNRNGKVLILSVFNDGHLSMAHSWLCNTFYMDIHQQVLLVVPDKKSRDHLRRNWPGIQVEAIPAYLASSGNQRYGQLGYVRVTLWRNFVLHEFIKERIELLLCEMDAMWIRNPIPETRKLAEGYDMAAIFVSSAQLGFGYMYIKPTPALMRLWQTFTETFEENVNKFQDQTSSSFKTSDAINDQMYLTKLLNQKYAGVRTKILSNSQFLDGQWYNSKDMTVLKKAFILNNNFVKGNVNKIKRAKQNGHWFLKESCEDCDFGLVNKTVFK